MHRRLLVALVVVLVAVPVFANHSWGGYHWARQSNPFTLKVYENMTSIWEPYLSVAASDWNSSSVLNISVQWNSPLSSVKRCSSATGYIEICNSKYGNTGWLGIAGISITGGNHITKGYTKLNDTYYNTATYNTPAWRQMVVCQEIGHDFGLDHQDENFDNANLNTCMDYTSNPSSNQHPNAHDYAQLESIYSHLDSTTTVGSLVFDGQVASLSRPQTIDEIMADAGQWGTPVRFDQHGRPNMFVAPNHEGGHNIVHVLWTPIPVDITYGGLEEIND